MRKVQVSPYNEQWPFMFAEEVKKVEQILGPDITAAGAEMDGKTSGGISYHIDWSIIESILFQRRDVIFDSR
jgi:hypothetical protein